MGSCLGLGHDSVPAGPELLPCAPPAWHLHPLPGQLQPDPGSSQVSRIQDLFPNLGRIACRGQFLLEDGMQLFINRGSHHQLLRQAWPSRHTILWALNCQTVTDILGLLVGDFWDKDNKNASNKNH